MGRRRTSTVRRRAPLRGGRSSCVEKRLEIGLSDLHGVIVWNIGQRFLEVGVVVRPEPVSVRVVALPKQVVGRYVAERVEREAFVDKTHVHVVGEELARRDTRSGCLSNGAVGLKPLVVEGLVGPLENVGN